LWTESGGKPPHSNGSGEIIPAMFIRFVS
jgi:hypothetical protein